MGEPRYVEDADKEWEEVASRAQTSPAYDSDHQARKKFSEVIGLCRTCEHGLIRRRQYSEVPQVICNTYGMTAHRVPLDIMECSAYNKSGAMTLRDMHMLGIIIDKRKKGGQYL